MKRLALKIDVDTYRGTLRGVPMLVELLQKHQAQATFLFSLGPDHTGRAIKRFFRPGSKKNPVARHYGLRTLMYGTLLPGPDIGKRCANILRTVHDTGYEVGIHCWDNVRWQDGIATADNPWVETEMGKACQRYEEIFTEKPKTHGAAGWQMNRHALRLTQRMGFTYSSDGRGKFPYLPVIDGEIIACPQLPTTLPTLDELLGVDDLSVDNVADHQIKDRVERERLHDRTGTYKLILAAGQRRRTQVHEARRAIAFDLKPTAEQPCLKSSNFLFPAGIIFEHGIHDGE